MLFCGRIASRFEVGSFAWRKMRNVWSACVWKLWKELGGRSFQAVWVEECQRRVPHVGGREEVRRVVACVCSAIQQNLQAGVRDVGIACNIRSCFLLPQYCWGGGCASVCCWAGQYNGTCPWGPLPTRNGWSNILTRGNEFVRSFLENQQFED